MVGHFHQRGTRWFRFYRPAIHEFFAALLSGGKVLGSRPGCGIGAGRLSARASPASPRIEAYDQRLLVAGRSAIGTARTARAIRSTGCAGAAFARHGTLRTDFVNAQLAIAVLV